MKRSCRRRRARVFIYSDTNFMVLGELVQRLSGMPLDQYADVHIFQPLGMKHTRFLPPPEWKNKIAETFAPDRNTVSARRGA